MENPSKSSTISSSSSLPGPSTQSIDDDPYSHIRQCIAKYSCNFSRHQPGSYVVSGKHVALSGATGNVGASMLDQLMRRDDVEKIYLLNRRSKESAKKSLVETFRRKDLDPSVLEKNKPELEYLVVDFSKKDLGLAEDVYNELRNNVTHIIHSAWLLNFMANLARFEPTHIAGVRHLIDLALSSPQAQTPRLTFLSTIAAAIQYRGNSDTPEVGDSNSETILPEAPVDDPSMSMPIGYGESKFISERILVNAANEADLRTTMIRVGQLSGMSTNGEWTEQEYGVYLMKSVLEIGVYPEGVPPFRWTPCDVAASAAVKQAFVDQEQLQYFSVENPYPTTSEEIIAALLATVTRPMQGMHWSKWLDYIEDGDFDPRKVPAVILAPLFRYRWTTAGRSAAMGWNKSVKVAPELARGPVDRNLITKYIKHLLNSTASRSPHVYKL